MEGQFSHRIMRHKCFDKSCCAMCTFLVKEVSVDISLDLSLTVQPVPIYCHLPPLTDKPLVQMTHESSSDLGDSVSECASEHEGYYRYVGIGLER